MKQEIYQLFGSRVRKLREERNVTQEELGRRVDLSRTSITNIEKGRQRVLLHQMVDIAEALEADPSKLIPDPRKTPTSPPLRDDVAKVVELLRSETKVDR